MLTGRRIFTFLLISLLALVCSTSKISEIKPVPNQHTVQHTVTLVAVGDVLLTRGIQRKIDIHGFQWPFAEVRDVLRSADVAFCNLECPLTAHGLKVNKPICFKADPANVQCLLHAGFDIVSLANNHALDCSRPGLIETMHCLEQSGIRYTGAGNDYQEATSPTVLEVNGLKIAFISSNLLFPESMWFRTDAPGMSLVSIDLLADKVRRLSHEADIVVVSLHWGVEYREQPLDSQIESAHKLVDAGAHVVLGHHPHVKQPVERYKGAVIAYSLGNFLFDSQLSKCNDSMILKCQLTSSGVADVTVVPIRLVEGRPTLKVQ